MKVKINYTSREVEVVERTPVFQHSHNIDIVQVAIDKYEPGLVYKMNFTDASGVKNLSRYMEFIGQVDDLYYFKVLLNSTNTAYFGDITMSVSIFTQEVVDEITKTVKIWNSETFSQYINQSEEDDTIDIDSEETTIIDEIYSAIALKLNLTHKGNYKTSALTGITLTNNTANFIANVYNALTIINGFDGVALVVNDSVVISDMPVGAINAKVCIATRDADGAAKLVAHITADGAVGTGDKYYGFMYYSSGDVADAFSGWKKYANNDDLDLKANLTGDNLLNGDQTINGHLAVRTVEIDETLNMTNGKISNLANGTDAGDAVNKSQLDLKTDKTYTDSELAKKADLAGGNDFVGEQTFADPLKVHAPIDVFDNKISNVADPVDDGDAVNKTTLETNVSNHNTSSVAHESIRELIQDLEREVSRIDNRGKSFGEVPYTTAELQAMDGSTLAATIKAAIEDNTWFEGEYTPNNGDLVYDEGVGDGVNYHEWEAQNYEYSPGSFLIIWVDNGAIASPKATNDIFGTVKGNSYVSIVAGLMQILLADNATYLKDEGSANKYTYQQIYDAIADRYTKAEVDALLDQLKAIYGWEDSVLVNVSDRDSAYQIPESQINDYDLVLISVTFNDTDETTRSMLLPPAEWLNGDHKIVFNNNTGLDGYIIVQKLLLTSLGVYFQTQGSLTLTSYDLKVTGIKMTPLSAERVSTNEVGVTVQDKLDEIEKVQLQIDEKTNYIYNAGVGLKKWYSVVSKLKTSNGIVNINVIGTSISSGGITTDYQKDSWVYLLKNKLKKEFGDVGFGGVSCGYPYALGTPLWTFSGTWNNVQQYGINGEAQLSTVTGSTATFNFNGNGISILVSCGSDGGKFLATIDDDTPIEFDTYNATEIPTKEFIINNLENSLHTLTITQNDDGKNVILIGAYELNGVKGFRVNNLSRSGGSSTTATQYENNIDAEISFWQPSLTIIEHFTNDYYNQKSLATFKSDIQKLITEAKLYGDVIILPNGIREETNEITQSQYIQVLVDLANENGVALLDTFNRWGGDYDYANETLMFLHDTVHPNNAGHMDILDFICEVLFDFTSSIENITNNNVPMKLQNGVADILKNVDGNYFIDRHIGLGHDLLEERVTHPINFISGWSALGDASIVDGNTFSVTSAGGIIYNGAGLENKWLLLTIKGEKTVGTSTTLYVRNSSNTTGSFAILDQLFDKTYLVYWGSATTLYLSAFSSITVRIDDISIKVVSTIPNEPVNPSLSYPNKPYYQLSTPIENEKIDFRLGNWLYWMSNLEAWITPTLTNATSTYLKYRKDTLGSVMIEGNITVTTIGTNFTLPTGYRPLFAYTVGNLTFNTDGTVVSSATGTQTLSVRFTGGV